MWLPPLWLPSLSWTVSASGPASPDLAWQRYDDLDLWSTWSRQVQGVDCAERRLRPGLTGQVLGPAGVRVPFRVTEVGEREWTWQVSRVGVVVTMHHVVTSHPGGSATRLTMRGPVPLVLAYAPLARSALGGLVRA